MSAEDTPSYSGPADDTAGAARDTSAGAARDTSAGAARDTSAGAARDTSAGAARDIAEVPAVEVVSAAALHLMSAAAVKCGLAEDEEQAGHLDLDEARTLIEALAGLVVAAAPRLGSHHAAPLRDGLRSLQLAFREASVVPDEPGDGPGERLTGPVYPTASSR
ncbi:hypothetical protein EV189_1121 [Motilibacter rhizosphaerae]|uniref:DUF1844 domain-containing protein n=1 Tax=Motilibacter rhizosphaerae TaxID=598652 RepID=A0A4Q7NRH1_9ACTN|nr:DUF1844 domain-containing protein [Motilibacter rhizosphaerae]RZS89358.1 hypothetical protein EV189_1121 [Motilibacter rhizosphaerae]